MVCQNQSIDESNAPLAKDLRILIREKIEDGKNNEEIYKFLNDNNANCTNVPYKFNRAVLFNSAYFHETDKINFKDEYEARRINITYLFGNRLVKKLNFL